MRPHQGGQAPPDIHAQLAAQRRALADRLEGVETVIGVMSGKGGVGKTAITANVAAALAARGMAVGAIDADLHGPSLARMLGVRGQRLALGEGGVQPAVGAAEVRVMSMALLADGPVSWRHPGGAAADTQVWRGLMEANTLRELVADTDWGGLDVLIVDLPPGADRFEVAARVLPLDRVLAVTIPSAASVEVVVQACHAAAGLGQAVSGLAVNMAYHVCAACGHEEPLFPTGESPAAIADRAGTPLLATIPFDARVGEAGDSGVPIVLTDPDRPASRALAELANALIRPAMAAPGMPLVGPA